MKKRILSLVLILAVLMTALVGCQQASPSQTGEATSSAAGTTAPAGGGERKPITMWFWGASPEQQATMQSVLVDPYNASQTEYKLNVEFRASVDKDISVALAANQGPDIVYGSGPSFVIPLADAGKLENLDRYAEQYGWKDRLLTPMYESGTVNGGLYSLPNSLNTLGIFYNKVVLEENGWTPPTTIAELTKIMDEAMAKGMYASVTGNKGWKPVNENYSSLFLTHFAGPQAMYNSLTGKEKWNNPQMVKAVEELSAWYKKGYFAGEDYVNLNFSESVQLLADKRSPFFIGPTLVFQFASAFFNEANGNVDQLGFIPFPSGDSSVAYPTYTLGTTATLGINANSQNKDAAAAVLDIMMSKEFMQNMTAQWPGYWGVPLKDLDVDLGAMKGLSLEYTKAVQTISKAINDGNFGYFTATFFPPATQQVFIDIDTVWNDTITATEYLDKVDAEFAKEAAKGLVPPIPAPKQ